MSSDDTQPVIAVDWDTVEIETDRKFTSDQREEVEQTGDTTSQSPSNSTEPFLIERNTSFHHPERGPLNPLYIPFDSTTYLAAAFKKALGTHSGLKDSIRSLDQWDSDTFLSGVGDLYDVATTLTGCDDGWYDGRHPIVVGDGFGSKTLDTICVRLAHTDLSVIEQLPIDNLPVEQTSIFRWDTVSNREHYTALYHHEDASEVLMTTETPARVSEYADDIGLLDMYTGPQRFRCLPHYQSRDYIKMNPIGMDSDTSVRTDLPELFTGNILQPLPPSCTKSKLYYEESTDGYRAHEWVEWPKSQSEFSHSRDTFTHVYLFDGCFDEADVGAAVLLDRHRSKEPVGNYVSPISPPSEIAHTLRALSVDEKIRLKLHDGRQITATVCEEPDYIPVLWTQEERKTGDLSVAVDTIESEDYRWLTEEQNGFIEITADERRGWQRPVASTIRQRGTADPTADGEWINLGAIIEMDIEDN